MFDKLKSKLHRHKSKKEEEPKAPVQSKPTNVNDASSVATPSAPSGTNGVPVNEKPAPSQSEKQPEKHPDTPVKDLWQEALGQLSVSKQQKLKAMGLDQLRSGSVKSDIDDLVDVVKKRQEEVEKKFWRVNVGDKDIVLRNYTTRIVGWLEKAGDIAVQFAPPQASVPWAVLKSVMQIPVIDDEQMAALLGTTEKVVRIISRGQVYEQVYLIDTPGAPEDKLSKNLQDALVKIYSTSLELLADSGDLFSKNTARRTLEAIFNPGHISGGLSDLAEQEDELLRDVQACESRRSAQADNRMIGMLDALNAPLTRVDENVQHLLEQVDESERIGLLEWISPTPFGKHHDNVKEKRTPGTGEWLLQNREFRTWEETNKSGIFWLQGSPGTGKTYLTSRVIDLFRDEINNSPNGEGFAFFYCDKNEKSRGDSLSIFQSYVRQLSTSATNPESMQSRLKEMCKKAREGGTTLNFSVCKEQILASLDLYPRSTLVIDAFDECDIDSRDQLMEALKSLLSETKNTVRIFISSRPDPLIQAQLEGSATVVIEASHNLTDIRTFLERELEKLAKRAAFIGRMKTKIIEKLLEQCQGMFQWASLQVHQIVRCKTEPSVWNRLENLPEDLQKAYDEVWSNIDSLEEPDRTLIKRALTWVMSAYTPMTSDELLSAIRVGSKEDVPFLAAEIDEEGLLSLCNNFLVLDTKLEVWRFSHLSVMEYLESKQNLTLAEAHCHAATTCLSFFINAYENEDPSTVAELPAEGMYANDNHDTYRKPAVSYDIFDTSNPFHIYMRHYWVTHIHKSQSTEHSVVASLLKSFLGAPEESSVQYRRWFKQVKDDSSRYKPSIDTSGWEVSGFDASSFERYKSELPFGSEYAWGSELEPENVAIFAMCRLAFAAILSKWWDSPEIDFSRKNNRGHNLLTLAAIAGSVPLCKKLLEKGIDLDARLEGSTFGSALVAAAHKGNTEVVKLLVKSGADVNMLLQSEEGYFDSALTAAVNSDHIETTRYLVNEAKADVNMPLQHEVFESALGRAAYNGNYDIVKCLVEAGAEVNKPIKHMFFGSVLQTAARRADLKTVKFLVQEGGADVNMVLQNSSTGSALESAAFWGRLETVKYLVEEAHADVNLIALRGKGSALAAAAASADGTEIVEYLLKRGADPTMPLPGGYSGSALAAAVFAGEFQHVKLLVEAGADVNMPLQHGDYGSALAAAGCIYIDEIVIYLLESGADVNMLLPGGNYGSALAAAASAGRLENVKRFVDAGADVNLILQCGDYGSALAAAAYETEIVKYLLEKGANVNTPLLAGKYGSALAAVAWADNVDNAKLLVEAGADVNMPLLCGDYGSALAAAACQTDVMEYLLEKGADVNTPLLVGNYGSALAAAARADKVKNIKTLLDAGADVNTPLQYGKFGSALVAAIQGVNMDSVKLLVQEHADVNMRLENVECGNAITAAAAYMPWEDVEVLDFLIESGADLNPQLPVGKHGNPLIAAAYFGRKDSAEHLIKAGADVNTRLENVPFATALQAALSAVSQEDIDRFRQEWGQDNDEMVAEMTNSLKQGRAEVVGLLRKHGATA